MREGYERVKSEYELNTVNKRVNVHTWDIGPDIAEGKRGVGRPTDGCKWHM